MDEGSAASWRVFDTRPAMNAALAEALAKDIGSAIAARGQALFGASGGSTPQPVYEQLAAMDLCWEKLTVLIVDERFVPTDHESSNQRMIVRSLLQGHADARCVGLWSPADALHAAARSAADRVRALARTMDLVLLGMGEDGHFASCFPSAEQYDIAIDPEVPDLVVPIAPMPDTVQPNIERITLTWAFIRRSIRIVLAIHGARKREVLMQAMRDQDVRALPIAALFKPGMPKIDVYWSP